MLNEDDRKFEVVEARSGPGATAEFICGEHAMLRLWQDLNVFRRLQRKNADKPTWSFLDGPITANNPMGVHHAWGRTYKDVYQRYHAMTGHRLRYQNGFDCQGLWVELEVERELSLSSKRAVVEYGIDRFVNACKQRALRFAARQTEQSIRLGYWMDWDDPDSLRTLAAALEGNDEVTITTPSGVSVSGSAGDIVARLGNPGWGGSYFTFSTENNETIWTFLKKCYDRGKIYRGHDVMPWGGRAGSAYSQMEVADGRRLTIHRAVFVRFPLINHTHEYLLVWTTTPWTLTSNVVVAVNLELEYVKIRSRRDGSVYYIAKDNLHHQRLAREFSQGFGRPEWSWPKGTPKLKTLAQILNEQGGFEELGSLRGAEMVGWGYRGPFDELPAQQQRGGYPIVAEQESSSVSCHRVIDGGRDSRGNPRVVAGEGTGIVHIAPGCGDVDYELGRELGLVCIAPLREDGCFADGFGEFTGRRAADPETAEIVIARLAERHLLLQVEDYPHIYPHCWRTGEELVFRLVDEWFIKMDWRDEIKESARNVVWLPASILGEEREIQWLTEMRDWMISKKRFWGLALPIWVDEETGDFEVIGSLAELGQRAAEGWQAFEDHTPHRPWIDAVKIRNPKNGNLMTRVADVGNPWLDAGIVAFSTMQYNSDRDEWRRWYPADLVTECFPGQFRNWFYSMLAMATMMEGSPPFRTLLGHRLVMNEEGQQMHKSDGTAIWFEEAAEQLGVDPIRWMFLQQNPAVDLRFGMRHPGQAETLHTVNGAISATEEGMATCLVTSKPADEVRRRVLMPLWNSYAFFANYARLDGFDPAVDHVPVEERPEIDRWLLSTVQAFCITARATLSRYDAAEFCRAASKIIDDLSSWYIRLNRHRFWRSRDASDFDKVAAYGTLYEALVTLTKLLAPCVPFITEEMYQNLVARRDASAPQSVHLCDYPASRPEWLNEQLNGRMAAIQWLVHLGHKARSQANLRLRQPLAELRYACVDPFNRAAIASLAPLAEEELNVKQLVACDDLGGLVRYRFKPNFAALKAKHHGTVVGAVSKTISGADAELLAPLASGLSIWLDVDGRIEVEPDDVIVTIESADGWSCVASSGLSLALSTTLTDDLIAEGIARDFVRQVQQFRKDARLQIEDRVRIDYNTCDERTRRAIANWADYIRAQTLADTLTMCDELPQGIESVSVGDANLYVWIARA